MGASDPRLDRHGKTDFRLGRQLRKYRKDDPPAQRVKPIPIQVVRALLNAAYLPVIADPIGFRAVADMICIAFYFLMRPGEHTMTNTNTPFKLQDTRLFIGSRRVAWDTATQLEHNQVSAISLVFTTQKNGVKGEVITHGRSGDYLCCPVRALVRRIQYHRQQASPPDTPLCAYYANGRTRHVNA